MYRTYTIQGSFYICIKHTFADRRYTMLPVITQH